MCNLQNAVGEGGAHVYCQVYGEYYTFEFCMVDAETANVLTCSRMLSGYTKAPLSELVMLRPP